MKDSIMNFSNFFILSPKVKNGKDRAKKVNIFFSFMSHHKSLVSIIFLAHPFFLLPWVIGDPIKGSYSSKLFIEKIT